MGDRNYLYEEDRFSPAVAAVVNITDDLAVYANYVEALTEGPIAPATAVNANEVFAPYVHDQKEIGIKYDLGSFMLTAALFEIRQKNGFTNPSQMCFPSMLAGQPRHRAFRLRRAGERRASFWEA